MTDLEDILRERNRALKAEVTRMQEVLSRKNRELDALHFVWCDGGCPSGVHRWTDGTITKDLVETAERNTKRLRRWYNAVAFRLAIQHPGEWLRSYTARAAEKTDLKES